MSGAISPLSAIFFTGTLIISVPTPQARLDESDVRIAGGFAWRRVLRLQMTVLIE